MELWDSSWEGSTKDALEMILMIHYHDFINIIAFGSKLLRSLLPFSSRTFAFIGGQTAVAASDASIGIATRTVVHTWLAIPEIASVAASQTVIIVSCHHDLHLTRKAHRSHLRAGLA